ncbi:hypothetical protein Tco_0960126 [Tanacetum coccineum]
MNEACLDRGAFVRELWSVTGETVLAMTAVFLEKIMDKEGNREWQLRDLEKEAREMAFEIESFLFKLMGVEHSYKRVFGGDDGQSGVPPVALKPHGSPLFRELTRVADSDNAKDQLSVLFRREVVEDSKKMEYFYKLSNELRETLDDMQAASRLMLMARETQDKVHEKTNFIVTLRLN